MGCLPTAPGVEESQACGVCVCEGVKALFTPSTSALPHLQPAELHFRLSPSGALSDTPDAPQYTVLVMGLALWTQLPSQALLGLWPEYPPSFMSLFLISATPSEEGKVAGRILPLRRERESTEKFSSSALSHSH